MKKIWMTVAVLAVIFSISCNRGDGKVENGEERRTASKSEPKTYTTENIDGTIYVHNSATVWGDSQPVQLELVRQVGRLEGDDENLTFYKPTDIALDGEGNLYVLDSGNHRVQKLSPDGDFLASFGKEGQGPGEFQFMEGIVLDKTGNMFITDRGTNTVKVLSPDGEEIDSLHPGGRPEKVELMKTGDMVFTRSTQKSDALLLVIDQAGDLVHEYGQHEKYENFDYYRFFNRIAFAKDDHDNIFIAYATRNKIEKYSPLGDKVLSIDRPLNYSISQEITYEEKQFGPRKIEIPFVNFVSAGLAVDSRERIWVLSYDRQLKYEEMALSIVFFDGEGRFEGSQSLKAGDEAETDAFAFHIFNEEGHFLGEIPITHHGGIVRIFKDRLYVLEPRYGMCVYIYNILE